VRYPRGVGASVNVALLAVTLVACTDEKRETSTAEGGSSAAGEVASSASTSSGTDGDASEDCALVTLADITIDEASSNYFRFTLAPGIEGEETDRGGIYLSAQPLVESARSGYAPGTYDLAEEGGYFGCTRCLTVNVDAFDERDDGTTRLIQRSGFFTLHEGSDVAAGRTSFTLTDVVLAEVGFDDEAVEFWFIPGGPCVRIASQSYATF
jgi:hypothetical protein